MTACFTTNIWSYRHETMDQLIHETELHILGRAINPRSAFPSRISCRSIKREARHYRIQHDGPGDFRDRKAL